MITIVVDEGNRRKRLIIIVVDEEYRRIRLIVIVVNDECRRMRLIVVVVVVCQLALTHFNVTLSCRY